MRIVPVIDLMGGRVVRAVGGRRSEYRPVVSRLCASDRPLDVARAFRAHFGLDELYVADLDAVAGGEPRPGDYAELMRDGFRLWVDAGVRQTADVRVLAGAGVGRVVVGLETVAGPAVVAAACAAFGDRIVFSLDLRGGKPLGDAKAWGAEDAVAIADRVVALGVRGLIVLDLTRVGGGDGTGTGEICARLARSHPHLELIAGGGVRGPDDVRRLAACGVRAALVASALHDGRLARRDWKTL